MRIRVLGPTGVDGSGELAGRDRRVLAALVVMAGRVCPPDRLAAALYGDDPPPTWRKVVQGSVVRLRRLLGPMAVETSAAGYRLVVGDDEIDARRFERLVRQAADLAGTGDDERSALMLRDALDLFRGDPLVDLDGWEPARAEAARLQELRLLAEERSVEALIKSGQHRDAVALAAGLVEEQPLREQRWAVLALAQYRTGRQADALRALNRARRLLAEELGLAPGQELVELERAILAQDPALRLATAEAVTASIICPYRGLAGYDVGDADEFFGREQAVQDCLARLASTGFVAVVGPSGCGKSSLARAGLAPVLRRPGQQVAVVSPGPRPARALRDASPSSALVIDQLEELFTLCEDPRERSLFVEELLHRAATVPVVVTLRSDHLADVAEFSRLAARVEAGIYLLRPMDDDDLRAAIEGPATRAGLRLEPGLVDLLVRDVIDQPGALPLLSHALTELWAHRDGRVMTAAAYRAVGGVQGAVGHTADLAIEGLPPEGRRIARELFLRLVTVTDGEPIRQRLPRADLSGDAQHAGVLDALTEARLLTVDDASVQVAHEALARAWPRLQAWLDEDREGLRILLHLTSSSAGWVAAGRDEAELYRGARLQAAEEWVAATQPTLTAGERAFLDASIARREADQHDLADRAEAQARSNRRLRRMLVTVAGALALSLLAGGLAVTQTARVNRARSQAQADSREVLLRGLLGQVASLRATKRDLAALLALAAYRMAPRADTLSALTGIVTAAPGFERTVRIDVAHAYEGKLLPDGVTYATTDERQGVRLIDLPSGRQIAALPPVQATGNSDGLTALSPDGRFLALVSLDTGRPNLLTMWDLTVRQRRFPDVALRFPPGSLAFSPDGSLVAVSGGQQGATEVRSAADGRLVASVPGLTRPPDAHLSVYTAALAFLPDGTLAVASQQGPLRIVDPRTAAEVRRFDGPQETASAYLTVAPDGHSLFGSGSIGAVGWDISSGRLLWPHPASGQCDSIAVANMIGALLCGRDDGHVVAFDLLTGTTLARNFDYQQGPVTSLTIAHGGSVLIEGGGPVLAVWDLDGAGAVSRLLHQGSDLVPQEYVGDGLLLVSHPTGGGGGLPVQPELVNPATGAIVDPLRGIVAATAAAQPPGRLAALFTDGTGGMYDTTRHQRISGVTIALPFVPTSASASGNTLIIYTDHQWQGIDRDGHLVPPSGSRPAGSNSVTGTRDGSRIFSFDPAGLVPYDASGQPTGPPLFTDVQGIAPTSTLLVVATTDGRLRVLDLHTLKPSGPELPAVVGLTYQVGLSADASRLLVVGVDRTVRVADMATRTFVGDPIELGSSANIDLTIANSNPSVAINADGTQLALGTPQGIVVWELDPGHLTGAACRIADRNLTDSEWRDHIGSLASRPTLCSAANGAR